MLLCNWHRCIPASSRPCRRASVAPPAPTLLPPAGASTWAAAAAGTTARPSSSRRLRLKATINEVPDASYDFVSKNQDLVRSLPLWAGGLGFLGILANRALSGIAPVVDASSSQSRADVLGILLSAVLLLTGLQWLSLKPKVPAAVALDGVAVDWLDGDAKLPPAAQQELKWAWQALQATSRATSLVLIYQGRNLFHAGMAGTDHQLGKAAAGAVCQAAMQSGKGNYLANLVLYPGRLEFVGFLPENTQGVLVQPVGDQGVLIVGCDTVRGISRLDQAWVATLADKLEVTLDGYSIPGKGFTAGRSSGSSSKGGAPVKAKKRS